VTGADNMASVGAVLGRAGVTGFLSTGRYVDSESNKLLFS